MCVFQFDNKIMPNYGASTTLVHPKLCTQLIYLRDLFINNSLIDIFLLTISFQLRQHSQFDRWIVLRPLESR